jgi:hypothetical protein
VLVTVAMGIAIGGIGAMLFLMARDVFWRWPKEDGKVPFARFRRKPKPAGGSFCGSCGSRRITFRKQSGFNTKTGQPRFRDLLACPDWDESAAKVSGLLAGYHYGYSDEPTMDCDKLVVTPRAPLTVHVGHADGDVSVTCKRCIIDMERLGIISHEDAALRLQMKEIA